MVSRRDIRFTAQRAGSYHWQCVIPCDDDDRGWAMAHDAYKAGTVAITRD